MKLYFAGAAMLLVSAGVLLVSGVSRSLGTGFSWISIACSFAAIVLAVAGVVRASR